MKSSRILFHVSAPSSSPAAYIWLSSSKPDEVRKFKTPQPIFSIVSSNTLETSLSARRHVRRFRIVYRTSFTRSGKRTQTSKPSPLSGNCESSSLRFGTFQGSIGESDFSYQANKIIFRCREKPSLFRAEISPTMN